ncbi:hypothetical protein ACS0TY_008765 [Phlomoides rotata]
MRRVMQIPRWTLYRKSSKSLTYQRKIILCSLEVLNDVGGTTIHGKIYSKDQDSGQNILLRIYLVNIRDFGHSNEKIPSMLTDGTSLEHSPQSVLLHQDSERSQNYHNGR